MTTSGESSPPTQGRPGPRWGGDGSLGAPPPPAPEVERRSLSPAEVALEEVRRHNAPETDRDYASFWRRLGAWLVDEAVKTGIWLVVLLTVTMLTGSVPGAPQDDVDFVALLPRLVLSTGYDWMFWSQGWTPGANVVGIRIVRADGSPPGPARGAVRVLGSMLSNAALFLGYLWMLRSKRRQTWHDIIAGTYVVKVPREKR